MTVTIILTVLMSAIFMLINNNICHLYAVYGCSMGGSIALLTALQERVTIEHCVMDGGITSVQIAVDRDQGYRT